MFGKSNRSSDVKTYDKSDEKPVHVDVDRVITGNNGKVPTLALLPNGSEEEVINNNGMTEFGNNTRKGNASVQRSD